MKSLDYKRTVGKVVRITITFIIPSVLVALLSSPELREFFANNPSLTAYAPIINVILIALVDAIEQVQDGEQDS